MTVAEAGQICHEANRALCETMGDLSQDEWHEAPKWQKVSAINGVEFHLSELRAGKSAKPEASHNNWLTEKRREGWTYGEIKDHVLKTHPCFLPFGDLPKEQQAKDYLFCGIVTALYKAGVLA